MIANTKLLLQEAERRYPVRVRIAVPPGGVGERLNQMRHWLDENCGAHGWAMTPSGLRGVVNDAVAIHFADAAVAGAFVALVPRREVQVEEGAFRVRDDSPAPRVPAPTHRTP